MSGSRKRSLPVVAIDKLRPVIRPDQLRTENQPGAGLQVGGPELFDFDESDPLFQQEEFRNLAAATGSSGAGPPPPKEATGATSTETGAPPSGIETTNSKLPAVRGNEERTGQTQDSTDRVVSSPASSNISTPSPLDHQELNSTQLRNLETHILSAIDNRISAAEEQEALCLMDMAIVGAEEECSLKMIEQAISAAEQKEATASLLVQERRGDGLPQQSGQRQEHPSAETGTSFDDMDISEDESKSEEPQSGQNTPTNKDVSSLQEDSRDDSHAKKQGVASKANETDNGHASVNGAETRKEETTQEADLYPLVRVSKRIPRLLPGGQDPFFHEKIFQDYRAKCIRDFTSPQRGGFKAFLREIPQCQKSLDLIVEGQEAAVRKFMTKFGTLFANRLLRYNFQCLLNKGKRLVLLIDGTQKLGARITELTNRDELGHCLTLYLPDENRGPVESQLVRIIGDSNVRQGVGIVSVNKTVCQSIEEFKALTLGRASYHLEICVSPDVDISLVDRTSVTFESDSPHRVGTADPGNVGMGEHVNESEGENRRHESSNTLAPQEDSFAEHSSTGPSRSTVEADTASASKPRTGKRTRTENPNKAASTSSFSPVAKKNRHDVGPSDVALANSPCTSSQRKQYKFQFNPKEPLGMYVISKFKGQSSNLCVVHSIDPRGQASGDSRIQPNSTILFVEIPDQPEIYPITNHKELKTHYEAARSKGSSFEIVFINSFDQTPHVPSRVEWGAGGHWKGRESRGWDGRPEISTKISASVSASPSVPRGIEQSSVDAGRIHVSSQCRNRESFQGNRKTSKVRFAEKIEEHVFDRNVATSELRAQRGVMSMTRQRLCIEEQSIRDDELSNAVVNGSIEEVVEIMLTHSPPQSQSEEMLKNLRDSVKNKLKGSLTNSAEKESLEQKNVALKILINATHEVDVARSLGHWEKFEIRLLGFQGITLPEASALKFRSFIFGEVFHVCSAGEECLQQLPQKKPERDIIFGDELRGYTINYNPSATPDRKLCVKLWLSETDSSWSPSQKQLLGTFAIKLSELHQKCLPDQRGENLNFYSEIDGSLVGGKIKLAVEACRRRADPKYLEKKRSAAIAKIHEVTSWISLFNSHNETSKLDSNMKLPGEFSLLQAAVDLQDRKTVERVLKAGPSPWERSQLSVAISRAMTLRERFSSKLLSKGRDESSPRTQQRGSQLDINRQERMQNIVEMLREHMVSIPDEGNPRHLFSSEEKDDLCTRNDNCAKHSREVPTISDTDWLILQTNRREICRHSEKGIECRNKYGAKCRFIHRLSPCGEKWNDMTTRSKGHPVPTYSATEIKIKEAKDSAGNKWYTAGYITDKRAHGWKRGPSNRVMLCAEGVSNGIYNAEQGIWWYPSEQDAIEAMVVTLTVRDWEQSLADADFSPDKRDLHGHKRKEMSPPSLSRQQAYPANIESGKKPLNNPAAAYMIGDTSPANASFSPDRPDDNLAPRHPGFWRSPPVQIQPPSRFPRATERSDCGSITMTKVKKGWMDVLASKECSYFPNCFKGTQCHFAHFYPPLSGHHSFGQAIDPSKLPSIDDSSIQYVWKQNNSDHCRMVTAKYFNSADGAYYFAQAGPNGRFDTQNRIWWYPTIPDAREAIARTVLFWRQYPRARGRRPTKKKRGPGTEL